MEYSVGNNQRWKDLPEGRFREFQNQLKRIGDEEYEGRWSLLRLGTVNGVMQACMQGPPPKGETTGCWIVVIPVPDRMAQELPDLLAKYVLQESDAKAGFDEE